MGGRFAPTGICTAYLRNVHTQSRFSPQGLLPSHLRNAVERQILSPFMIPKNLGALGFLVNLCSTSRSRVSRFTRQISL